MTQAKSETIHQSSAPDFAETTPPAYSMRRGEELELTRDLLEAVDTSSAPDDARFVSIQMEHTDPHVNLARIVEREVFYKTFKNTPRIMRREYGKYEKSRFWLAVDREEERPAGALRAIPYLAGVGLKAINDMARSPTAPAWRRGLGIPAQQVYDAYDDPNVETGWVEAGTVAVRREYRGLRSDFVPSMLLFRSLLDSSEQDSDKHMVAIVDKEAKKLIVDGLGVPFEPIAGTEEFEYLGSGKSHYLHAAVPRIGAMMLEHSQMLAAVKDDRIAQMLAPMAAAIATGDGLDDKRFVA